MLLYPVDTMRLVRLHRPTEDCSSGAPSTCNLGCARVLLPFFTECSSELGNALQEFQGVIILMEIYLVQTGGTKKQTAHPEQFGVG